MKIHLIRTAFLHFYGHGNLNDGCALLSAESREFNIAFYAVQ
jgi:hypothetical protein